jgi:hypothetical protein
MSLLLELLGGQAVTANIKRKAERVPREVRNAVRRAATLQAREIKTQLKRKRTGLLAKSIGSKVKDKGARATGLSGPRRGFKVTISKREAKRLEGVRETKKGNKKIVLKASGGVKEGDVISATRYAHLVESGHKKGKGRAAAPPYPFMKPAFKATEKQVRQMVKDAMAEIARA